MGVARPAGDAGPVGGHLPADSSGGAADRAATIAVLAAAIAQVGSGEGPGAGGERESRPGRGSSARPRTGGGTTVAGRGRGAPTGDRGAPTGDRGALPEGRGAPPEDPAGPSGDDPGDPEAVARAICLRQLTVQARSRAELEAALRRRGIAPEVAARVLDRFAEVGLVDDAAYAQAFVASKHRDRGLGRSALRTELRRKGIDGPAAEDALRAVDADAERARAAAVVAKRLDSAMFAGLPAARRRLLGLLARRGYSASLSAQVVNEALRGFVEPAAADPDGDVPPPWEDEPL